VRPPAPSIATELARGELRMSVQEVVESALLSHIVPREIHCVPVVEDEDSLVADQGRGELEGEARRRGEVAVDHDEARLREPERPSAGRRQGLLEPALDELDAPPVDAPPAQELLGNATTATEGTRAPGSAILGLRGGGQALEGVEADEAQMREPLRLENVVHAGEGRTAEDAELQVIAEAIGARVLLQEAEGTPKLRPELRLVHQRDPEPDHRADDGVVDAVAKCGRQAPPEAIDAHRPEGAQQSAAYP